MTGSITSNNFKDRFQISFLKSDPQLLKKIVLFASMNAH